MTRMTTQQFAFAKALFLSIEDLKAQDAFLSTLEAQGFDVEDFKQKLTDDGAGSAPPTDAVTRATQRAFRKSNDGRVLAKVFK